MTAAVHPSDTADATPCPARSPALELPVALDRPIRVGVLSNPMSGRNVRRGQFEAVRRLSRDAGVPHHEADDLAGILAAAEQFVRDETEVIVVNGGDGTVQATLTAIFEAPATAHAPLLVILPGGTTNMTGADLCGTRHPLPRFERLLAAAQRGRLTGSIVRRRVIRIAGIRGHGTEYGMFFGAGAVYHGIRFCRERIYALGLRGEIGPGVAVVVFVGKLMLGQKDALLPPLRIRGMRDGHALPEIEQFGVLLTTLERLFLHLNPFWGKEDAPLRFTTISYTPRSGLRAVWPIVRGRPNAVVREDNGYASHNADAIELQLDSGFTVDGELFAPQPETPLTLTGGPVAHFLRLDDA